MVPALIAAGALAGKAAADDLPAPTESLEPDSKHALVLDDVTFGASSEFRSQYVARGVVLHDGPSAQNAVSISGETNLGTFTLELWTHNALDSDDIGTQAEIDISQIWSKDFKNFELELYHGTYFFPNADDDLPTTSQVRGSVNVTATPLPVKLTLLHDYDEIGHTYAELGTAKPIGLSDEVTVTPSGAVGYAIEPGKFFAERGFTHINLNGRFTWQPKDKPYSVSTDLNYVHGIDDATTDGVSFGLQLGFQF